MKYATLKRGLDFLSALLLIILLSPLLLLTAVLIRLSDGSPVFFKQKRPGLFGRIFTIYKFRTMNNDGSLAENLRLTRLGKFLRRTSIDELPQLMNILKGEMSFIGPRPLLVEYLSCYSKEQMRRHDVLPGISGYAQVNGRNAITWAEKFKLDLFYVDNISLLLDLKVVLKTLVNVTKKSGINNSSEEAMPIFKGDS